MKRLICLFLALAAVLSVSCCAAEETPAMPVMQLHQLSISGTMSYVLMAEDCAILIDTGLDFPTDIKNCRYDKIPALADAYISELGIDHFDAHIVTHWHNDHSYGIHFFNEKYGTDDTVLYGVSAELPPRFVIEKGRYCQLQDNDTVDIGPFHITVIGPEDSTVNGEFNEHSLNFIFSWGRRRFLFTGDSMLRTTRDNHMEEIADVDVFQFPHHGFDDPAFEIDKRTMKIVNPALVILPGRNRGKVRIFMRQSGVTTEPDIFPMEKKQGIATVLLCDGETIQVLTDREPGSVTRTDYPRILESNTTAR